MIRGISTADAGAVCCMCGDVGFSDKLFRCNKCRNRFQHSYCSNYYSDYAEQIEVCDWCRSPARHDCSSDKSSMENYEKWFTNRSGYSSGTRIKQHPRGNNSVNGSSGAADRGKNSGGAPSPRTATRRYKLLKDVMC